MNCCPKELENMKKENLLLFDKDPTDSYYILTSEINFLDSTDSFQNVYTKTEAEELACASSNNEQQRNSLSAKVLRDFETPNSADRTEFATNYTESCSPMTFFHSPVYNCQHSHCEFGWRPRKSNMEMTMKTVSVSTDLDPSLKSNCLNKTNEKLTSKFKPHDNFIMQAVDVFPLCNILLINRLIKMLKPVRAFVCRKFWKPLKRI